MHLGLSAPIHLNYCTACLEGSEIIALLPVGTNGLSKTCSRTIMLEYFKLREHTPMIWCPRTKNSMYERASVI